MLTEDLVAAMVRRARALKVRLDTGNFEGRLGREDVKTELEKLVWRLKQYRTDGTPIRVDCPPGPSAWDDAKVR